MIQRPTMLRFFLTLGRERRITVGVRLVATLLLPFLSIGASLFVVYVASAYRGFRSIDIDDIHIFGALAGAAVLTGLGLLWIWRPLLDRFSRVTAASIALHLLASGAILGGCLLATAIIDRRSWLLRDEEVLLAAIWLIGVPLALTPWVALAASLARGRDFEQADREQQVVCPTCRYAMAGLRQASCPECGTDYTLEELFERQGYAAPKIDGD